MKFSSLTLLPLLTLGLFFAGCEQHSFESTQVLHGDHGGGHGDDHGGHGDGHDKDHDKDHGKKDHADDHGKEGQAAPAKEAEPKPTAEPRKTGL